MQGELFRKWLMPLKEQCVKLDNEYKDAHQKAFDDICALIAYQYRLNNIMEAFCYRLNCKIPKGIPVPFQCRPLSAETLCAQTRSVFQTSNRFIETLIKYLDSYRKRNVCIDIINNHDKFLEMLVNRNQWFLINKNLIPAIPKIPDLTIIAEIEKPVRAEDDVTRKMQSLFMLSDRREAQRFSFDSSYTPTVSTVSYLQAECDKNRPLAEEAERITKELNVTRRELLKEKMQLEREKNKTDEYIHNLPLESIVLNRLYQDYVKSAKELLPEVRKNITGLVIPLEKITNMLREIDHLLKNALPLNSIYSDELENLRNQYVEAKTNVKKLQLFQKLIKNARLEPYNPNQAENFIAYERDVIESIIKALKSSRYGEITLRIEAVMEQFSQYEKTIPEETERFRRNSNAATNNMQHWGSSRPKHDITELKQRVDMLANQHFGRINSTKQQIHNCLEMHRQTVEACKFIQPIKDGFQNEINDASEREAHRKWLLNRIEERKKIIKMKKAKLEKAKKELASTNEFLEKKEKEINDLMEAKKNKAPIQRTRSTNFEEYEEQYQCPLCQSNKRNVFIAECGHTFCKNCIDDQIKSRNRKCSSCGKRFDKMHVLEINYGNDKRQ